MQYNPGLQPDGFLIQIEILHLGLLKLLK